MGVQHGVLTTRDAAECGVDGHGLQLLCKRGRLTRLRTGCYVDSTLWAAAGVEERLALRALAVYRTFGERWAVSHASALALYGLPLPDLGAVAHLSRRTPGPARSRSGLVAHVPMPPEQLRRHRDAWCSQPGVALVQAAGGLGLPGAVASADAALHRGLVTSDELTSALGAVRVGPGRPVAAAMAQLADGRSESAGESRCRVTFVLAGLPVPVVQAIISDGQTTARVDFLFRQYSVIVEFDGALKYDGANGRAALVAEKRREDWLRSLGFEVVRITWRDLDDPLRVRRLVLAAMARASRRPTGVPA